MHKVDGHIKQKPKPQKLVVFTGENYPIDFMSGHIWNPSLPSKVESLSFFSLVKHDKYVDPCVIFPTNAHQHL
jgi:hypothetical protein